MARKRPDRSAGTGGRGKLRTARGSTATGAWIRKPLAIAWGAFLVALLAAGAFFAVAYQEGGPRRGGELTLAMQSEAGDTETAQGARPDSPVKAQPRVRVKPRIAVIVTGLGLARDVTRRAIEELPPDVALSFSPYAKNLPTWFQLAREKGHEVLLDLPMEPVSFPNDDPGPKGLLTLLDTEQNLERLDWVLSQGSGQTGVVATMGSRFLASEQNLKPVLAVLKERGLLFVDNGSSAESATRRLAGPLNLYHLVNDRVLDDGRPSRASIRANLLEAEQLARSRGTALALGHPYPATLETIIAWASGLDSSGPALTRLRELAGMPPAKPKAPGEQG